ncbi:hypothetical protein QOM21_08695 [Streptomyces sp. Pv4-95]|uniref:hypothetical protein n=1 Tax=Streptomyces sp. Pv4-95 TaxID=3049543 RepID=UPI003892C3BF
MPESTTTTTTTAPYRTETPAVALGPTALLLGVLSAVGAWAPALTLGAFPLTIIAGGLAVTLGAAGIHYARHGTGRLWTAIAGTAFGIAGFTGAITLLWAVSS